MTKSNRNSTDSKPKRFLRVYQIVGDKKRGIEPMIPIGRSTFLAKVQSGEYPQPVRLGPHTVAWEESAIVELMDSFKDGA
jgi:prophage regulatory protein